MATDLAGERSGLAEALAERGEDAEAERALQLALFEDLDIAETGALDAPSPMSKVHPLAELVGKGRAGRKPGSKNRRTEATVKWLLSTGRHPVAVMQEYYSCTPKELAERLGLQRVMTTKVKIDGREVTGILEIDHYPNELLMELVKLQARMVEAAAPYLAQKLPQAVQLDARGSLTIGFEGVSLPARAGSVAAGDVIEGEAMAVNLPQVAQPMSQSDE